MYTKPLDKNKHCIVIIGDANLSDSDFYAKEQAERNFERLNSLFGIIDSKIKSCTGKEGSWYLQNIVFNLLLRLELKDKKRFLEGMESVYDEIQNLKNATKNISELK